MLQHSTPQARCRFGFAVADITPPVGIYHRMWGAATHDRSTGIHRPLEAAALVFRPFDDPHDPGQVLVALDHCLLWAQEYAELHQAIAAGNGLDPDRLVLTFSHTHAAGLLDRSRAHLPGGEHIGPYLDRLAAVCTDLAAAALKDVAPAHLVLGTGRCDLAAQRDCWDDRTGQFVCGYHSAGETDDAVLVTRITGDDGRPRAILVNYACHPTTLAWGNTLVSPDYVGALRETVTAHAGCPCVFLQGASGDLGPREGYVADPAAADRNGRQLGYAVLAALESLPPPGTKFVYQGPVLSGATLGDWRHEPLSKEEGSPLAAWQRKVLSVPLRYRPDLPTLDVVRQDLKEQEQRKSEAENRGDAEAAAAAHALIERLHRQITRQQQLPPGPAFPMPVVLLAMGDCLLVAVEGELYHAFQKELRRRLPDRRVLVVTLAGGWRCSYLPTAAAYGKGIYQETVAVLAQGCLEKLLAAVAGELAAISDQRSAFGQSNAGMNIFG